MADIFLVLFEKTCTKRKLLEELIEIDRVLKAIGEGEVEKLLLKYTQTFPAILMYVAIFFLRLTLALF